MAFYSYHPDVTFQRPPPQFKCKYFSRQKKQKFASPSRTKFFTEIDLLNFFSHLFKQFSQIFFSIKSVARNCCCLYCPPQEVFFLYYQQIFHNSWMSFQAICEDFMFFLWLSRNNSNSENFQNLMISSIVRWIIVWTQIRFNQIELLFYFNGNFHIPIFFHFKDQINKL